MIFTQDTPDDAAAYGAWHLYDKQLHPDPEYSWAEAVRAAEGGVSEVTKNKSIVVDEDGHEVATPAKWKDYKSPVSMAMPKWDASAERGRKRRRSRSDSCNDRRPQSPPPTPHPPPTPPSETMLKFARHGEVLISKFELDHLIDGIDRGVDTCDHCASYATRAASVFESSAKALKEAKHHFERLKRV